MHVLGRSRTLNEPDRSDIARGFLYVADRDGGTVENEPSTFVIRWFSSQTGAPAGEIRVMPPAICPLRPALRR